MVQYELNYSSLNNICMGVPSPFLNHSLRILNLSVTLGLGLS